MADWMSEYRSFAESKWEPTKLNQAQEAKFESWMTSTKLFSEFKQDVAKENNIPVESVDDKRLLNMMLSSGDYDYRGAWKAGIKEEVSKYDGKVHWPSSTPDGQMLKSPNHPTTWKEFFMRQYNKDPDSLGLSTIDKAQQWSINRQNMTPRRLSRPMLMEK